MSVDIKVVGGKGERPKDCPFCERIGRGEYVKSYGGVVWFEPLNPVTPGHMLFVPVQHFRWSQIGGVAGVIKAMGEAVLYATDKYDRSSFNIIASCGPAATQTVEHVHVHVVPRHEGDGLQLPWS